MSQKEINYSIESCKNQGKEALYRLLFERSIKNYRNKY